MRNFVWEPDICMLCGGCASVCSRMAIIVYSSYLEHDEKKCIRCERCAEVCPVGAISFE